MELDESEDEPEDEEPEEEPKENAVHESSAEVERPMHDSDLRPIDRECFDALSAWLSGVSLARNVGNRRSFEGLAKCFSIESVAQIRR